MTSYGRNKNHDDEIKKNQEKSNNSPSYRCAAIKHNRLTSGEMLPNDRRAVGFSSSQLGLRDASIDRSVWGGGRGGSWGGGGGGLVN